MQTTRGTTAEPYWTEYPNGWWFTEYGAYTPHQITYTQ